MSAESLERYHLCVERADIRALRFDLRYSIADSFYLVSAVGVSGGPDSMALCLLAAEWKISGLKATSWGKDDVIDGLLAIIVDHGLREESKDEAEMVQRRVLNMGTVFSPLAVFGVKALLEQEMVNVGSL